MNVLGIDNVFFAVGDLEKEIEHYQGLGLPVRFVLAQPRIANLAIGTEEPGLILREEAAMPEAASGAPCFVWLEVPDAEAFRQSLTLGGNAAVGEVFPTGTGYTVVVRDPWGSSLGFADYRKKPELARKVP